MRTPFSLGGKSPADQKKKSMPSLLMLSVKGKPPSDAGPQPQKPAPPSPAGPDDAPDQREATGKTVKPGTAMFTSQDETCSTCEHFDDAGNGGVGACKKGVPEADYSVADPTASRCRFYEGSDDATESDEEKVAEGEMDTEDVPA